jgi:hypothetical protein
MEIMMINKATVLGTSLSVALLSTSAFAANIGNTSQKGSLLIFPKIDVTQNHQVLRNTFIRITNDNTAGVDVKCYYETELYPIDIKDAKGKVIKKWKKDVRDFKIHLTANQPVMINAYTGDTDIGGRVNPFPRQNQPHGVLKCWAVNAAGDASINWNHLSGTATVFENLFDDTAYEYTAWAFKAKTGVLGDVVDSNGDLALNGKEYEYCPRYLIGHFTPEGGIIDPGFAQPYTVINNDVTAVSCTEDLRQDRKPVFTKLAFDVWNTYENKFTEPFECADSYHQFSLTELDNGPQLDIVTLGDNAAYFRMEGIESDQCVDYTGYDKDGNVILTQSVGLVGIMRTFLVEQGTGDQLDTGTNLTGAGKRAGSILWDKQRSTAEKK